MSIGPLPAVFGLFLKIRHQHKPNSSNPKSQENTSKITFPEKQVFFYLIKCSYFTHPENTTKSLMKNKKKGQGGAPIES
tara:strand:- start:132 stop:368 length:237 start_codon:yes stop_codon:yes gene_type:complete